MSAEYKMGLAVGLIAALVAAFAVKKLYAGKGRKEFDERQLLERGIAYRNGFYTLLALVTLYALKDIFEVKLIDSSTALMGIVVISVAVFAITAIRHDAYVALNRNTRSWVILGFLVGGTNLVSGAAELFNEGGEVAIFSLLVGIVWLVIVVVFLLHNRKTAEVDEE